MEWTIIYIHIFPPGLPFSHSPSYFIMLKKLGLSGHPTEQHNDSLYWLIKWNKHEMVTILEVLVRQIPFRGWEIKLMKFHWPIMSVTFLRTNGYEHPGIAYPKWRMNYCIVYIPPQRRTCWNSLEVQWLGLRAFTAGAQVQSLDGELKSHKPRGMAKTNKQTKMDM